MFSTCFHLPVWDFHTGEKRQLVEDQSCPGYCAQISSPAAQYPDMVYKFLYIHSEGLILLWILPSNIFPHSSISRYTCLTVLPWILPGSYYPDIFYRLMHWQWRTSLALDTVLWHNVEILHVASWGPVLKFISCSPVSRIYVYRNYSLFHHCCPDEIPYRQTGHKDCATCWPNSLEKAMGKMRHSMLIFLHTMK